MIDKEFKDAYTKSMKLIAKEYKGDPEVAHSKADDLLCAALKDLGFKGLVAVFKKMEKWYA